MNNQNTTNLNAAVTSEPTELRDDELATVSGGGLWSSVKRAARGYKNFADKHFGQLPSDGNGRVYF